MIYAKQKFKMIKTEWARANIMVYIPVKHAEEKLTTRATTLTVN